ncbi:hypothetical protein K439DRAFT_1614136 [Ramaria rubella]|nr:hypothetical protein K439DRAFT_1614136 [Ramaria rubella]
MHRAVAAPLTHAVHLDPVRLASSDRLCALAAAQTYFDFNAVFMLIHSLGCLLMARCKLSFPGCCITVAPMLDSAMEGAAEPALPDSAHPSSPHPGPLQAPHPLAATTKPALEPHPQSQPSPIDDASRIRTSIPHLPGLVVLSSPRCRIRTPIRTCTHVHTHTPIAPTHLPPPHHAHNHTPNTHALAHTLLHPPMSQEVSAATDKPPHTS